MELDKQILLPEWRLRVNYDGTTGDCDYECKTFKLASGWKNPKKYAQQMQVQMWAGSFKMGKLVAYGLEDADYNNYLRVVDPGRLIIQETAPDPEWISRVYLPKLRILRDCLIAGRWPDV